MSNPRRTVAVIGVFGPTGRKARPWKELADELGYAIARRRCVLLTGGTGAGGEAVKEWAIDGAKRASSPWIGVAKHAPTLRCSPQDSGLVIYTDLGDARNYLEACLCDAAIGLPGGPGTLSEVTFSLSLQRPVVLLGDSWKSDASLDGPGSSGAVDSAFRHIGEERSGNATLDKLLNKQVISDGLRQLPPHAYLPSGGRTPTEAAEEAVDWIVKSLQAPAGVTLPGYFPALDGYETVRTEYDAWLAPRAS